MSVKSNPFSDQKRFKRSTFEVDFEESDVLSQNSQQSQSSSQATLSQRNSHNNPFADHKKKKNNAYDVDWEESVNLKSSQESNSSVSGSSQGMSQKNPFAKHRKQKNNAFEVDWEESVDMKSSQESNSSIMPSQDSRGVSENLFVKHKKQKGSTFKVDLEESCEAKSSQEMNSSVTSLKNFGADFKKPNLFSSRRQENAFNVEFEESKDINSEASQLMQKLSEDSSHVRSNVFAGSSKRSGENEFDVSLEESRQVLTGEHPDEEVSELGSRKMKENFFKAANRDDSNVSTMSGAEDLPLRKKLDENSKVSLDKWADKTDSLSDTSASKVRAEKSSQSVDFGEMNPLECEKTEVNSQDSEILNETTFNDENLNQWMSDHSEDEAEMEEGRISPPDLTAPSETLEERIRARLQEVIEQAKKKGTREEEELSSVLKPKNDQARVARKARSEEKEKRIGVAAKPQLKKPAKYANRRLYEHVIKKIKPRFGIDAVLKAEEVVVSICETVKLVTRRKAYQKRAVESLKKELAAAGLVETTFDFYNFVRDFLPQDFREKVIPCIQPGTNIVHPPKDAKDPFEKIL